MSITPIDPSLQQLINIGVQSNDGTGDSIRDAFAKTNSNFNLLFGAESTGSGGLRFANLPDYAGHLIADPLEKLGLGDQVISTRRVGNTSELVRSTLTSGTGISIEYIQVNGTETNIKITNDSSRLSTDPNPYLSANLSGTSTYRAVKFANPIADQDLVTRQYLYDNFLNRDGKTISGTETNTSTVAGGSTLRDNVQLLTTATTATHLVNKFYADTKISLAGIDAIDSFTGQANPAFGTMTGPLILSRKPVKQDDIDNGGYIAATKNYVDDNTYYSGNNIFVTKKGRDYQPDVPPEKRGRNWQYAFGSLNYAAQYAEQLIAVSQIEVGDYARLITYDAGTPCTVATVSDADLNNLVQLALNVGLTGSDQFGSAKTGRFTIFPGQYVQGVDSGAIALIEGIAKSVSSGDPEIYTIAYVDYAANFNTAIRSYVEDTNNSNIVKFKFEGAGSNRLVPIPEFWVGYKFYIDPFGNGDAVGTIISIDSVVDNAGIYTSSFTVEFTPGQAPGAQDINTPPTASDNWHVYAGDFMQGETLIYNTDVSALQISFMIESGEYTEQYPIRLSNNTSIRGDEFRRVIIRPARGVSNSPWSDIYFRRDAQIDGLQTAVSDKSFDFATVIPNQPPENLTGNLANKTITSNTSTSGINSFSLSAGGVFPKEYVGYIFVGNGGQGVVVEATQGGFVVNMGSSPLLDTAPILPGDWHIYKPITFGYQYLRDPKRPLNVLTTATNLGGLTNAAAVLLANRASIQQQSIDFITANYFSTGTYDSAKCSRDVGIIVDGLAYDMIHGGWLKTVNAADSYKNVAVVKETQLTATVATVVNIDAIVRTIFSSASNIEPNAYSTAADLIQACARIIDGDTAYNPPKDNSQMDVFLCNDANVLRYLSCQNHGGFMMVLDPQGQIKNKSPYCQTASSFSQSIAKQAFRGGMLVDGFSGNVQATPVDVSNPLELRVKGLRRRPQVPTFFNVRGIRYEVDFFADFVEDDIITYPDGNTVQTYAATLRLNPLAPGGIPDSVSVSDISSPVGFTASTSYIPIIIDQPSGVGGLGAKGYATSDSSGKIVTIRITFPGTGYTTIPSISVGGAIFNNLVISKTGTITGATIVSGGSGYAVGCGFKIVPVGAIGAVQATGHVTAVDSIGAITGFTFDTNGANWDDTVQYQLQFGDLSINVPEIVPGFIDTVPETFELVTAGNRSMLANDYTQVNDLGYGILCTNGGLAEDVSMFTYYCYRAYYSCNGAQIRSTTGSCGYGEYALTAEGSDPNEVPTTVALSYPLTQVARAYVNNPLYPAVAGQTNIFVYIDLLNGGYPPLNGSQVEINHSGIIKTYTVGAASPALDSFNLPIYYNNDSNKPVYELFFTSGNAQSGTGNLGLLATLAPEDIVIIRAETLVKLTGLNPDTVSRPSTSLVFNDDPTQIYHVTGYSTLQPDSSVYVYTLENYNYITCQSTEQGLTYPTLDNTGSGYTTATVSIGISQTTGFTHTVQGTQGVGSIGVQTITLDSVSNILIGHVISGNSIITGTVVTYINSNTNIIGIGLPTIGQIADTTVLTFLATPPQVTAQLTDGAITSISINKGGAGWNVTSTTIGIIGDGIDAHVRSPINIAGVPGSFTIKISPLDLTSQNRIAAGLANVPIKYYQFAVNDQFYNILAYRSPTDMGQSWGEIDIDRPLNHAVAQGTILRAGIPVNSGGTITSRISTMRATGHDFLNIGTGGYATTRYPNDLYGPPLQAISQLKEVTEINKGRVYYMSTDQDGNFRVGSALRVNQAQGSVSISVPIDLSNLTSISLKRDLGPPVNEFSTDNTMITEADYKVPTEQAVANYLNRRLGIDRNGAIYSGSALGPQFLDLAGLLTMKGSIKMGNHLITNLLAPRATSLNGDGDAVNKSYADGKVSSAGTWDIDADRTRSRLFQNHGVMTGPLQLYGDPTFLSVTVLQDVSPGPYNTEIALSSDDIGKLSIEAQVNGVGIPEGSSIYSVNYIDNTITLTSQITSTLTSGTVIGIDPIVQAVNKRYVDKHNQLNQLNDVTLTNPVNNDFLMFGPPLVVNTTTNPPVYNAGTRAVNVSNDTAVITNNTTSNGGGSDLTVVRSNNTVTFKLVGGQGSNNPITNYHVNDDAQIQQAKLWLNTATVTASAPTGTQRNVQLSLGSAQFDNVMFTANNGWISLRTGTNTADGIIPTKHAFVPAGGGLLGATNTAADNAASYVSSSSVQTWLQNIGSAWSFNSNLNPQTDILEGLGTSGKRWSTLYANTAILDSGLVLNTNASISTDQTTANLFNAGVTTGNLFGAATAVNIGSSGGATNIKNAMNVTGPVAFADTVTFNGTATYVVSTNTVFTDNLIELHVPNTGINGVWASDDNKDIGFRIHYYNGGDLNAALVMAHDSRYLEWYDTGADSGGVFTGTTYGTFKTGVVRLAGSNAASNQTSGDLIVSGGVGIGGSLYAGNIYDNSNRVVTSVSPSGSNHLSVSASVTTGPSTSFTITSDATNANTGGTIVARNSSGDFSARIITASLSGNASSADYASLSGNASSADYATSAGSAGNLTGGVVSGSYTLNSGVTFQATYADLAERYQADAVYEPGTILEFGGDFEVTVAEDGTRRVAGIVTTNPAYVMNVGLEGENVVVIALAGRVPCKVQGIIRKGDMLVAAGGGFARAEYSPVLGSVIGKALQDFNGGEGVIEVAVGRA